MKGIMLQDKQNPALTASQTPQLDKAKAIPQLETSDDLAMSALSQASQNSAPATSNQDDDELEASDQLATTLNTLQTLIEKHANTLTQLNNDIKEKRQMLKNVFDNDGQLSEAQVEAEKYSTQVKERRSQLQSDPQVTKLKIEIGEDNEQKKELEETLSNYLVNYHQLTNSTSFDTSDGDQWEFSIRAKIKTKK